MCYVFFSLLKHLSHLLMFVVVVRCHSYTLLHSPTGTYSTVRHSVRHLGRLSSACGVYGDFVLEPVLEAGWEHPPNSHSPQPSPNSAKVSRSSFSLLNAIKFSGPQRLLGLLCVQNQPWCWERVHTWGLNVGECPVGQQDLQIPRKDRASQPSPQTLGGVMSKNSLRLALLLFVAFVPRCSTDNVLAPSGCYCRLNST